MTPEIDTRPTLSHWSGSQRQALRLACQATRSQRARSEMDSTDAVLLCILATMAPRPYSTDEIARRLGLTAQDVADAMADLEDAGKIENGTCTTGKVGILTPAVLAALGLGSYGLQLDNVRADVTPSGSAAELSSEALTASFGPVSA